MKRDMTEGFLYCVCGATFMDDKAAAEHNLRCFEPKACESCGTTEEGCTDNYHPKRGWCCQDCRDSQEYEDNENYA